MVATRKSLALGVAGLSDDTGDRNLPVNARTLKELQIDGGVSLGGTQVLGPKRSDSEVRTYTWRGAVFEVDHNTKEEWIRDTEVKRRKTKSRQTSSVAESRTEEDGAAGSESTNGKKRARDEDAGAQLSTPQKRAKRGQAKLTPKKRSVKAILTPGLSEEGVIGVSDGDLRCKTHHTGTHDCMAMEKEGVGKPASEQHMPAATERHHAESKAGGRPRSASAHRDKMKLENLIHDYPNPSSETRGDESCPTGQGSQSPPHQGRRASQARHAVTFLDPSSRASSPGKNKAPPVQQSRTSEMYRAQSPVAQSIQQDYISDQEQSSVPQILQKDEYHEQQSCTSVSEQISNPMSQHNLAVTVRQSPKSPAPQSHALRTKRNSPTVQQSVDSSQQQHIRRSNHQKPASTRRESMAASISPPTHSNLLDICESHRDARSEIRRCKRGSNDSNGDRTGRSQRRSKTNDVLAPTEDPQSTVFPNVDEWHSNTVKLVSNMRALGKANTKVVDVLSRARVARTRLPARTLLSSFWNQLSSATPARSSQQRECTTVDYQASVMASSDASNSEPTVSADADAPAPASPHTGDKETSRDATTSTSPPTAPASHAISTPGTTPPSLASSALSTHSHVSNDAFPVQNRGGDALRWSLDVEKLSNGNDAASNIVRARMQGESKSARRRRIKREQDMVLSWRLLDEAG